MAKKASQVKERPTTKKADAKEKETAVAAVPVAEEKPTKKAKPAKTAEPAKKAEERVEAKPVPAVEKVEPVAEDKEPVKGEDAKAEAVKESTSQPIEQPIKKELDSTPAKDFTAYLLPEVAYSEEAALDLLRQKLRAYKEINPEFLAMTEKNESFKIKREYIPVYREKAIVDYDWTVKSKGGEAVHTERREVCARQHNAPAFFRADSMPADIKTIAIPAPKSGEELYPCKEKSFASCVAALKKEAKSYSPQLSATKTFYNLEYEIFYVPVMKATCVFEGEEYVAYVNMLNGECDAQYRVSDRLRAKADKTMRGVVTTRRFILAAILYALTFVGLGWYAAVKGGTVEQWSVLLIGMSCAVAVQLVAYGYCFTYNRKKFVLNAVRTGKMPKAALSVVMAIVSALVAVAELAAFIFYLM